MVDQGYFWHNEDGATCIYLSAFSDTDEHNDLKHTSGHRHGQQSEFFAMLMRLVK